MKNLFHRHKAATFVELGLLLGLISILLISTLTSVGTNLQNLFGVVESNLNSAQNGQVPAEEPTYASCLDVLTQNPSATDGLYPITLASGEVTLYCDMTTNGGGWMLLSHIYDRDNRDDIPDNNGGTAWGDPNNTPTSDTSFNILASDSSGITEGFFDWRYPNQGDAYTHPATVTFIQNRFNWSRDFGGTILLNLHNYAIEDAAQGRLPGVFGTANATNQDWGTLRMINSNCGNGANSVLGIHYYGWGNVINIGTALGPELHNLTSSVNRSSGDGTNGCGTRNAILNIWAR